MNNVLSFVPAGGTSSDSGSGLYSDHMLAELLALPEGMIIDPSTSEFFKSFMPLKIRGRPASEKASAITCPASRVA